jgi:hypothetical protein
VEIFRALGISEKFHEVAIPQSGMSNNLWCTTPEVARSQTWGTGRPVARDGRGPRPYFSALDVQPPMPW